MFKLFKSKPSAQKPVPTQEGPRISPWLATLYVKDSKGNLVLKTEAAAKVAANDVLWGGRHAK